MFNLPPGSAGSLSFLSFSLVCLSILVFGNPQSKLISCLLGFLGVLSFIAALLDYSQRLKFPVFPCKKRLLNEPGFCWRDRGFSLGFFLSIVLMIYSLYKGWRIDTTISFLFFFICTISTIIHGILRRKYSIFVSHEYLTFVLGFLTGIGTFWVWMFLAGLNS